MPHVANTLPAIAVNKKTGNEVVATAYPSSATRIKCSKNSDYNIKCKDTGSDSQRHDCPTAKTVSNNQQAKQVIQPTIEIAARCESSARKCKKALKEMKKLLRTSRRENYWHKWNLWKLDSCIRQSEYNATVMPASVREQFNPTFHVACMPKSRVFTPRPGNVKSTTLSTETARSQSSPPTYASAMGLTSCQASRCCDELERQHPDFIRPHTVRERTPTARTFVTPMSTPAVRMARTKQTARKDRDDRQRSRACQQEGDRRRDRSNTPPRRARPRSPSPNRLECVFCGLISHQRRNHRRHLIIKHNCRPDGTPATAADIEEARREEPESPTARRSRYKSREFVETDSDDETTPIGSGASTPSERRFRRRRDAVVRKERKASPLSRRHRRATHAVLCNDHQRYRHQPRQERRRRLRQRRQCESKYAKSDLKEKRRP